MNGGDELSLKDITFLRAIRDINESPERYASTEAGVTPATVTAITEATTLSEDEVAYRLDHPRLGKSGLVKVYEAGPPGHDSAGLNSAKLTEAGEAALADAEERQASVDAQEWRPGEDQSEFDDVQEWEPADVESHGTAATSGVTAGNSGSGGAVTESSSISEPAAPATTARSDSIQTETETGPDRTVRVEEERLAALESRLDELEAEQAEQADSTPEPRPADAEAPDRVEALSEEVEALRETTESLEDSLETALETVGELEESEYGALDAKREEQFQTAVKSMVAFHQLATEVLDVRVENYEPAAGHPEPDRVEISRNRIGDALGVGQSGGGSSEMALSSDDSSWPSPEEAGGRVFDGGDETSADERAERDEPEQESDAPDTGVYPPIGEGSEDSEDSPREVADQAEEEPEQESDAPESGVYPPLGGDEEQEPEGEIEEASEEADERGLATLPAQLDAETLLPVWSATVLSEESEPAELPAVPFDTEALPDAPSADADD